jgi:uncharacterized protein with HEPN domain
MSDRVTVVGFVEIVRRACGNIIRYTRDLDRAAFLADDRTQYAVAMNLQIIGEAAASLRKRAPEVITQHPTFPFAEMIALRHVISHDYDALKPDVLWMTATTSIIELQERIAEIVPAEKGPV